VKVTRRFSKSLTDIHVSPRKIRGDFMAFSRFERFENMDPRVKVQKEGAGPPLFLHFPVFCKFFFGIYDDMVIMELV
jgi:hypothetical protein